MKAMRRADRLVGDKEAYDILEKGEYGILATVDQDNQPYGAPVSYAVAGNHIYFHGTSDGGYKYDNISHNSKVSLTVVGKTEVLPNEFATAYESVVAFGEASLVTDEAERLMAFREILKKYSSDFLEEGEKYIENAGHKTMVIKIQITKLTGKHRTK